MCARAPQRGGAPSAPVPTEGVGAARRALPWRPPRRGDDASNAAEPKGRAVLNGAQQLDRNAAASSASAAHQTPRALATDPATVRAGCNHGDLRLAAAPPRAVGLRVRSVGAALSFVFAFVFAFAFVFVFAFVGCALFFFVSSSSSLLLRLFFVVPSSSSLLLRLYHMPSVSSSSSPLRLLFVSSSSSPLRLLFVSFSSLLLPAPPPSSSFGQRRVLPLRCAPTPLAPRCPCNCMWLQAATIAETSAPSVWGAVCWVVAAHRSRVCGNPTPVLVPSASQSLGFRPSGLGHRSKPATTACSSKPRGV